MIIVKTKVFLKTKLQPACHLKANFKNLLYFLLGFNYFNT